MDCLLRGPTPEATRQRRIGVVAILALLISATAWGDIVVKPKLETALHSLLKDWVHWLRPDVVAVPTLVNWISICGHVGMVIALCALPLTLVADVGLARTTKHPAGTPLSECKVCGVLRPAGSHHCRTCDACTVGFDHHCGFLGFAR